MHDFIRYAYIYGIGLGLGSHIGFGETSDLEPPSSDRRGSSRCSRSSHSSGVEVVEVVDVVEVVFKRGVVVADLGVPGFRVNGFHGVGDRAPVVIHGVVEVLGLSSYGNR